MSENENILGTESNGKLLITYSVPGVISMLVNSIYNMVDQIFIGNGVGYLGNGATTVSFPFVQLLLALSIMTSADTAANAGLNLGRKNQKLADGFVGSGFGLNNLFLSKGKPDLIVIALVPFVHKTCCCFFRPSVLIHIFTFKAFCNLWIILKISIIITVNQFFVDRITVRKR